MDSVNPAVLKRMRLLAGWSGWLESVFESIPRKMYTDTQQGFG